MKLARVSELIGRAIGGLLLAAVALTVLAMIAKGLVAVWGWIL